MKTKIWVGSLLALLFCVLLTLGISGITGVSEPPYVITVADLEWVEPDAVPEKVYNGENLYAGGDVAVQIKAGAVNNPTPILVDGIAYLDSANAGTGKSLTFRCYQYYNAEYNFLIPADVFLTRTATVLPNNEGTVRAEDAQNMAIMYTGESVVLPQVFASNGASAAQMSFVWRNAGEAITGNPVFPGEYTLFASVPDLPNGKGVQNAEIWSIIILPCPLSVSVGGGDILLDKTNYTIEDLCGLLEASLLKNHVFVGGNFDANVTVTAVSGCVYTFRAQILQNGADVTAGYTWEDPTITVHVGTTRDGRHLCERCYGVNHVSPIEQTVGGDRVDFSWGYILETVFEVGRSFFSDKAEDFTDYYFRIGYEEATHAHFTTIQCDLGTFLQYLISDKPLTKEQANASTAWQLAEIGKRFDFGENERSYVYFRWMTVEDPSQSIVFALPYCLVQDRQIPLVPSVFAEEVFFAPENVLITDNLGISSITITINVVDKQGRSRALPLQSIDFDNALLPVTTYEIPASALVVDGEVMQYGYSIVVYDLAENRAIYNITVVSVARAALQVLKMTADNVQVSNKLFLQDMRAQLLGARGILSDSVRAERDAVVAHIDTLLAKIDEMNAAEATFHTDTQAMSEAFYGKLPTAAVIAISVGSTLLITLGAFVVMWFAVKKKSFAELFARECVVAAASGGEEAAEGVAEVAESAGEAVESVAESSDAAEDGAQDLEKPE